MLCVCRVVGGVVARSVFAVWRRFSSSPIRFSSVGLCFAVYLLVRLFSLNWAGLVQKKKKKKKNKKKYIMALNSASFSYSNLKSVTIATKI